MQRNIQNILFYGLMIIILLAAGTYVYKVKTHPGDPQSILGVIPLRILSGSMEPKFMVGTYVFSKAKTSYEKGDIISFKHSGVVVTHRIFEVKEDKYITKGDNNRIQDGEPINKEEIIGKVIFYIPAIPLYQIIFIITGLALLIWGGKSYCKKEIILLTSKK